MTSPSSSRRRVLLLVLAAVVVVAIGGGLWWYFSRDAPKEVTLDAAIAELTASSLASGGSLSDPAGLRGTWMVDPTIGEFSYAEATGNFVGFRVDEELAALGSMTAVGRTPQVTGIIAIVPTSSTEGETEYLIDQVIIEADMRAVSTNDVRRDNKARDALGVNRNPISRFVLTEPIVVPPNAIDGAPMTVVAQGELTVNGVTQPIAFPLEAQLVGDTIAVIGSTEVEFADYDVQVPSARIVISAEERGTIEVQLFFRKLQLEE